MLKVMILDDEAIARIGLVHALDWKKNGFRIVGETGDISSAREMALNEKPDIILVDIILRQENGLDFVQEMQPLLPFSKFILVSCMNDPEYYRRAISLHVSSFIGKAEISSDELLEKLNQAAGEIYQERVFDPEEEEYEYQNRFLILDNYINRHLAMKQFDQERFEKRLETNGIHVPRYGYSVICVQFRGISVQKKESLADPIMMLSREILTELSDGYVFWDFKNNLVMLAYEAQARIEEQLLETICYRLTTTIEEIFSLRSVGEFSDVFENVGDFALAWEQAEEACRKKMNQVHPVEKVNDAMVSEINRYIQTHLEENPSLSQIADVVHFAPSYVSRYYKKATGINIKDFIADCRIERAKQMLQEGKNLNFITERLGFCSASHFIHVFGSKTGMTPKEYLRGEKEASSF